MAIWRVNEGSPDHGIIDENGHLIAMVTTDEDQPQEPEEVLRNAVLIAAAPEMFALLRECSTALAEVLSDVDSSGLECQEQWACVAECKKVIAKAEGRGLE